VSGHGYLKSPRSRNFVGNEDGKWWGGPPDGPAKETCAHCLNRKQVSGTCGAIGGRDYDHPPSQSGFRMKWQSQATYTQGQVITIEAVLTAHHKGHFELYACALKNPEEVATKSCFEENPLKFVKDVLYGSPKDKNYPMRAYVAPNDGNANTISDPTLPNGGGMLLKHEYRLPNKVFGEHVLIQWKYYTANSCEVPGYDDYDFPSQSWRSGNLGKCSILDETGDDAPERFWNCAEVTIAKDGPSEPPTPPAPTDAPITPPPSKSSEPTRGGGGPTNGEDSRLIAYVGNWQKCPTSEQTENYTHIMIAFAVTYQWSSAKNICDESCTISMPPVCNNSPNPDLIRTWQSQGKEVLLSFGGAGMGGSWSSSPNDCWEYCFGVSLHYYFEKGLNVF